MRKTEQFLEARGETFHVLCMEPEGEVDAVLQIVHGMQEYTGRYEPFASFLCENRIAAAGQDYPGHGPFAKKEDLGFFGETQGMERVLDNIRQTTFWLKQRFPQKPLFILGHSMGSLFLRYYLTMEGACFSGAVIMGTSYQEWPAVWTGKLLSGGIKALKGPRHISPLLCQLVNGNMNRKFQKEGENAWLSKDRDSVRKYNEDPLCQFPFTCSAYYEMFRLLQLLKQKSGMEKIPKDLPVLLTSGEEDPVGGFGRGVKKAYRDFSSYCLDCSMKLYPGKRHEILNETGKEQVYQDLLSWILMHK